MDVELTGEESRVLQQALQSYLSDLRMEIADTDNPAYRRELKQERETLEAAAEKLTAAAKASSQRDTEGRPVIRFVGVWVE